MKHPWSEQRALARHTNAARKPLWTRCNLTQHLHRRSLVSPPACRHKAEFPNPLRRPSLAEIVRRLRHHQVAAQVEQGRTALRRDRGRPEAPGHDDVRLAPLGGVPSHLLRPPGHHRNPVRDPEASHRVGEEPSAALPGFDKGQDGVGPGLGQHQAGHASPAPQVDGVPGRPFWKGPGELPGMHDVSLDGPGSEEPQCSRLLEDVPERDQPGNVGPTRER